MQRRYREDSEEIRVPGDMQDDVASEFPPEQSTDDQLLQFFGIDPGQQDSSNQKKEEQNWITSEDGNVVSMMSGRSQDKRRIGFGVKDGNPTDNKMKKIIHRDIERQRRQEMTLLYATLRSQLPLEYLKGKRSISDHMHEAVKYIKHLQNRIMELRDKRDELIKGSSDLQTPGSMVEGQPKPDTSDDSVVVVRACFIGVEISIKTGLRQGLLPLSNVLDFIVSQGLSVVNCISTRVNERVLHTINVLDVNHGRNIDLSELQQELTKLIIHSTG
ncbi:hypothetical protein PTKIN_Ptkin04bG0197000 [Pterospermum kingtungense]